jgi:hypothetical protein
MLIVEWNFAIDVFGHATPNLWFEPPDFANDQNSVAGGGTKTAPVSKSA